MKINFNESDNLINKNNVDSQRFTWLISADAIFTSAIENYTNYSNFYSMEFSVSRFSICNGISVSDTAIAAKNVIIHMPSNRFCASIQGKLASGAEITKISLKKISALNGLELMEEKTFNKCVIQTFERKQEISSFSFRYKSYCDSYTDYGEDGQRLGTAATTIDLTSWEVE